MSRPHVTAICGSLREESHTRKALAHALASAAETGGETELLDLREWDLPVYDADEGEAGDAQEFTDRVRAADSILLGTPVYHGSYATPLKNALDYCGFDEFENKTVGLLAVAGGAFPITALDHLRSVCRALNAWVVPHQAAIPRASSAFEGDAEDWQFVDESAAQRVAVLGERVVEYAAIQPDPPCLESVENVGAND